MKRWMWIVPAAMLAAGATGDILRWAPREAAANPYAASEDARHAGRKLFERYCAQCHGKEGEGIGRAPSLAARKVKDAPPGTLFWILRNGSRATGMPSFSQLPDERLWQIVTYLQSAAAR